MNPPRHNTNVRTRTLVLSSRQISFDGDVGGGGFGKTVVADPLKIELSASRHHREKRKERVGCGCGEQVGAENLLAFEAAGETCDDVARHHLARRRVAITRLHDVRHQRLDFDDVAIPGFLRHVDQVGDHQIASSGQAAYVTTTSAVVDQSEPSESLAMAMIFWLSASRTRVATWARPARGVR